MRTGILVLMLTVGPVVAVPPDPAAGALEAYESGDYEAAIRIWEPLAADGDPTASYRLAYMNLMGQGVPPDTAVADNWLRKAAYEGHALAADCLAVGRGMSVAGRKRLHKAAKKGNSLAQYYLAKRLTGLSMFETPDSIKWYRAAAEGDVPAAQLRLGEIYMSGAGVERNDSEAEKWLLEAVSRGVTDAYLALGDFYLRASESRDIGRAAEWFARAAEDGDVFARLVLGIMYSEGRGVPRDRAVGYMWVRLAQSDESLAKTKTAAMFSAVLTVIASRMTDEELARGEQMARRHPGGHPTHN